MCSSLFATFSGGNNADAVSSLDPDKKIVLAEGANRASSQGKAKSKDASTTVVTKANLTNTQEVIVPVASTYEVKEGDTLAGIALHAYKRVSPRLLDTICKANNMRNANVLTLGQKIVLPEYRPIYIQTGSDSNVNR
jgi:nucleoid-associated protein YgaU